ncbi:MAG TPA: hypothetical protein VFC96_01670 [Anaerovoracaceae bacterium]|nr:hypothetical protein [Anaerovoracaceae bacterium]
MRPEILIDYLLKLARSNKLSHAYILEGPDIDRLYSFALEFANRITAYSEDIYTAKAEGLSVKDKTIWRLLERLNYKPLVGDRNIAIIRDADTMTTRAQNRLLKTLEEPPGKTLFLILVSNSENLLLTVKSRCIAFRLGDGDDYHANDVAKNYAHTIGEAILKGKGYYTIAEMLKEITKERVLIYDFLDELEKWYRDILLYDIDIPSLGMIHNAEQLNKLLTKEMAHTAILSIEKARQDLSLRINGSYAIKNMILQMI